MPVIYSTPVKTARMQAVVAQIDAGSGFGRLELGTSAMGTVLATLTLSKPCGTVTGSVLTLSGFPKSDVDADATGVPVVARIVDSDGNEIISGLTVGSNSGDVRFSPNTIVQHQTVTVDSAVFTHA